MSEKKKRKPSCKKCPKRTKPCEALALNFGGGEDNSSLFSEGAGEKTLDQTQEASNEEDNTAICEEEEESCKEIATGGFVLDHIIPDRRKVRPPFFCPLSPKARYENIIPVDVVNDHQYEAYSKTTVLDHLSALRVTSEPFCRRQPAIIATVGNSCTEVKHIEELLDAGMNIVRVNMATGDRFCHLRNIQNIKEAIKNYHGRIGYKVPVGLMLDLKGPVIRTGNICKAYICNPDMPEVLLEKGTVVKITNDPRYMDKCSPHVIYVDFTEMPKYVRPGMTIFLENGNIKLYAEESNDTEIQTVVEIAGYLKNNSTVYVPMVPMVPQELTKDDLDDVDLAVEENFDFVVISRIYSPSVISDLKAKFIESLLVAKKLKERPVMILAKISNFLALKEIDEILEAADGIFIEKCDLSLDLPLEKIYIAQREIIAKCNLLNKPVICSAQISKLSMKRCELESYVYDVASSIEDGADCICLTEDMGPGKFSADTVEQTHHIIREALAGDGRKYHFRELNQKLEPPIEPVVAIGMAACVVADKVRASAIISLTTSGKSARIMSWFRPRCPILAVTRFERTARQMNLWRAICPLIYRGPCVKNNWFDNLDLQFQFAINFGKEVGYIKSGDPLVLVSCYGHSSGFTNCLRVVYASTEPGVFLDHSRDFYNNALIQNICRRAQTKNDPCTAFK